MMAMAVDVLISVMIVTGVRGMTPLGCKERMISRVQQSYLPLTCH